MEEHAWEPQHPTRRRNKRPSLEAQVKLLQLQVQQLQIQNAHLEYRQQVTYHLWLCYLQIVPRHFSSNQLQPAMCAFTPRSSCCMLVWARSCLRDPAFCCVSHPAHACPTRVALCTLP
jgi:hypothetical protein